MYNVNRFWDQGWLAFARRGCCFKPISIELWPINYACASFRSMLFISISFLPRRWCHFRNQNLQKSHPYPFRFTDWRSITTDVYGTKTRTRWWVTALIVRQSGVGWGQGDGRRGEDKPPDGAWGPFTKALFVPYLAYRALFYPGTSDSARHSALDVSPPEGIKTPLLFTW